MIFSNKGETSAAPFDRGCYKDVTFEGSQSWRLNCLDISLYEGKAPCVHQCALPALHSDRDVTGATGKTRNRHPDQLVNDVSHETQPFIRNWVASRGCLHAGGRDKNPALGNLRGALRLLFIEWSSDEVSRSPKPILPFAEDDFSLLRTELGLPEYFLDDFAREGSIPIRFEDVIHPQGQRLGIYGCKKVLGTSSDLVLSFDPATSITYGFLAYNRATTPYESDLLSGLIGHLTQAASLAVNPLLVPVLVHETWASVLARDTNTARHYIRQDVERETGLMKDYLKDRDDTNGKNHVEDKRQHIKHTKIHETIVSQHAYLCNGLSDYVNDNAEAILAKLKTFGPSDENTQLRNFMERQVQNTKLDFQLRDRLLGKLDMQIQVLYALMQQHDSRTNIEIADETKRDGSAMKTLSLITTIFLPATAIASIFSMDTFFSTSDDTQRIQVSPQFWIFWSIVGPLTLIVLLFWTIWINRKQVHQLWTQFSHIRRRLLSFTRSGKNKDFENEGKNGQRLPYDSGRNQSVSSHASVRN